MTLDLTMFSMIILSFVFVILGSVIFFLYRGKNNNQIDYEFLFNESPFITWILDIESKKFLMVNDTMVKTYGYTREELLNMQCYDIRVEEEHSELDKVINKCWEDFEVKAIAHHKKKSGELITVEIKIMSFNFNGRRASLTVATDISDRLKAEQDALKAKADMQALIENTDDAIWSVDREGLITVVNDNYRKMYASVYGSEIEVGMSLFAPLPEDIKKERMEMFHRALQGEKIKFGIKSKFGGEVKSLDASMNPIVMPDGTITGVAYFSRDITQTNKNLETARNSEERYRRLIETMNDGLLHNDHNNIITFANERFFELIGYEPGEIIGKDGTGILLEDSQAELVRAKNDIRKQGICDTYELKMRKKNGEFVYVIVNGSPLYNNDGSYAGSISTLTNITDRKESEDRVYEINKELDQFAYVVSHDLKAPLRAINNLSMWIEEDLEERMDEETRKSMTLLRSRVSRMEALINGVLDYSRVGRQIAKTQPVVLEQLLEEVKDTLSPPSGFQINIPRGIPPFTTETLKLQQVFQNLISNAVKYHDKDHGTVDISVKDMGEQLEFSVKDDGPGIDPQYHDKIFVIFQTLQSRDDNESTGVGLSIVKKIIKEAGGDIRVESNIGEGASFIFTWPKKNTAIREGMLIAA